MNSDFKELLLQEKKKYRLHVRKLPLTERLRNLEELQEQSYEILRIREQNGGRPIPEDWQRWAKAQKALKK